VTSPRWAAAGLALPVAGLAGCGGTQTTVVVLTPPPAITITDTAPPTFVGALSVTLQGQPTRSFIVFGGRWRVCDTGTVTNQGSVVAPDVRILATYVDKGVVVGQTTRDDAAADGGVLGDIAPGASAKFTFCAIAHNEPDVDRLVAVAGSAAAATTAPAATPSP
jgi:hypothetical protein